MGGGGGEPHKRGGPISGIFLILHSIDQIFKWPNSHTLQGFIQRSNSFMWEGDCQSEVDPHKLVPGGPIFLFKKDPVEQINSVLSK